MIESKSKASDKSVRPTLNPAVADPDLTASQAEEILEGLAGVFDNYIPARARHIVYPPEQTAESVEDPLLPNLEARYRALVEQIPAVVFMAYLDRGIGEAYVSPQIEAALGFSQEEWLEDPVRWYSHIHPDDKHRWSIEAAEMFLNGSPLRSSYRVISRDGRVIWFHCEAKMIRKPNGEPWFIHGVGFDITDLKRTEEALQEERNVVSAILHTVGALVVVLDPEGRIIRCNRAYEQTTGYSLAEVTGQKIWDLFMVPEEVDRFQSVFQQLCTDQQASDYEMACDDTPLRGSRLVIEDVPVIVFCPNCNVKRPLSSIQLFCCGECGTPTSEIVQGKELEVVALEIQ